MLEVKIKGNNKKEMEHFLYIMLLGLIDAVKNEIILINMLHSYIVYPNFARQMQDLGYDSFYELIMNMCELEDILSLLPEKFVCECEKFAEEIKNKIILLNKEDINLATHLELFSKSRFYLYEDKN